MKFFSNFIDSWNLIFKEKKKLLLMLFLDFLFFLLFFLFGGMIMQNIVSNFNILQEKGSMLNPDDFSNSQESINNVIQQLQGFQDILSNIFLMIALFAVGVFFLWCLFQGINWFITNMIVNKKSVLNFKNFLKLNVISLFWFVLTVIFFILFSKGLVENLSYQEKAGAGVMILVFFFVAFYFLSIGYGLFLLKLNIFKSIKDSFIFGIKKIHKLLPVFLSILIVFSIAAFILYFLRGLFSVFGIVGFFVFLLLVTWSRIFILLNLKEIY